MSVTTGPTRTPDPSPYPGVATPRPTLAPLIGSWRTQGYVLDDDGSPLASIDGTDVYEWLGPTVVHHVDVVIDGRRTRAIELIEAYDDDLGAFPTRVYDDQGSVDTSTASVDSAGVWTFREDNAHATLLTSDDGRSMRAAWVIYDGDGEPRPWMTLRFTRL